MDEFLPVIQETQSDDQGNFFAGCLFGLAVATVFWVLFATVLWLILR